MRRALVALFFLTSLSGVAGCFGPAEEEEHYVSSDNLVEGSHSNPGGKKRKKDDTKPLVPIPAGEGAGSSAASQTAIAIDGTTCSVATASLDVGIEGRGWTLHAQGSCPTAFVLAVSGVSDEPYPQTNVQPFIDGATLYLARPGEAVSDTFSTANNGNIRITAGPTAAAQATVSGSATVVDPGGAANHTVRFDSAF